MVKPDVPEGVQKTIIKTNNQSDLKEETNVALIY